MYGIRSGVNYRHETKYQYKFQYMQYNIFVHVHVYVLIGVLQCLCAVHIGNTVPETGRVSW